MVSRSSGLILRRLITWRCSAESVGFGGHKKKEQRTGGLKGQRGTAWTAPRCAEPRNVGQLKPSPRPSPGRRHSQSQSQHQSQCDGALPQCDCKQSAPCAAEIHAEGRQEGPRVRVHGADPGRDEPRRIHFKCGTSRGAPVPYLCMDAFLGQLLRGLPEGAHRAGSTRESSEKAGEERGQLKLRPAGACPPVLWPCLAFQGSSPALPFATSLCACTLRAKATVREKPTMVTSEPARSTCQTQDSSRGAQM